MKQELEKQAKGTSVAVPAAKPIKARSDADIIAVRMICRSRNDKTDVRVETTAEQEVWRRADDLAGSAPTPLLKSLALTVALCEVDTRFRQALNGPLFARIGRDHQNALSGSMRRYLAACRALAVVQRLNLPSIQVNVAQNQVVSNN